jgi:Zn-dependent peptidase ImmA (M78 family)
MGAKKMIKFKPRMLNKEDNRTPAMYDREIDDLAHSILADYKPELLRKPGKINVEHFLEQYLEADLRYLDIFNEEPERPILALTTFTDGDVDIFDYENECVSRIDVPVRTVIIDNVVEEIGNEGLALFSGLHESGHLILHWDVFVDEDGIAYEQKEDNTAVICCRRENIERMAYSKNERTPAEWREHQADYFAAAIAMPNVTFRPTVINFLRENGVYKGHIQLGNNPDLDILAHDLIPEYISELYGVSKRAARIKLKKHGFVSGKISNLI